ncbi:MAG TPA: M48 family metalloprotease, partial [Pirellulaceae bacterium]|nr:M48 family metalloprotease [Pirellulaceae bacterium]
MDFFASQDLARRNTRKLVFLLILAVIVMCGAVYALVVAVWMMADKGHQRVISEQGFDWQVLLSSENLLLVAGVVVVVLLIVSVGSMLKVAELRTGGVGVAEMLGGRRLIPGNADLAERRVLNVVEEMALASGVPVPPVYILDNETGINAFAAGHTIDDAVIGVNRGTVEKLNREELQGVIAHEFSHILNGDMRM